MIKAVDTQVAIRPKKVQNQREHIRNDIYQAIGQGIKAFEFIDDCYNYKYLPVYAREESEKILFRMYNAELRRLIQEDGRTMMAGTFFAKELIRKWCRVTSHTDTDRIHVYMVLDIDTWKKDVEDYFKSKVDKAVESYQRYQARKGER